MAFNSGIRVRLRDQLDTEKPCPVGGLWKVVIERKGWCELFPLDDRAKGLARLDPCDRVLVRHRDLIEDTEHRQETLL